MNLVELEELSEFWEETTEPPTRDDCFEAMTDIRPSYDFEKQPQYICWQGCWIGDSVQTLAY